MLPKRPAPSFGAEVKDSSLVSVLGVADLTQMGNVYASGSVRFSQTFSMVVLIYLLLTVGLSLELRARAADAQGGRGVARSAGDVADGSGPAGLGSGSLEPHIGKVRRPPPSRSWPQAKEE